MTYRAAYINDSRLTGPEHAHLPDEELIAIAVDEMARADILGDDPPRCTADAIEIGEWTEVEHKVPARWSETLGRYVTIPED